MHDDCPFVPGIEVPLDRQRILLRPARIGPEAAVQHVPTVGCILAGRVGESACIHVFCEDAVACRSFDCAAILHRAKSLL